MNSKTLVSGLIAGIAFFFLGWLIYGMLLMDAMSNACTPEMKAMARPETEMIWWALILSNLISGWLLAMIFDWSGTNTMSSGISRGAMVGLFMSLAYDLSFYSMTKMYNEVSGIWMDVAAGTVMTGVVGALLGWWNGRGAPKAAA